MIDGCSRGETKINFNQQTLQLKIEKGQLETIWGIKLGSRNSYLYHDLLCAFFRQNRQLLCYRCYTLQWQRTQVVGALLILVVQHFDNNAEMHGERSLGVTFINHGRAEFISGNMKIYLHFLSSLSAERTQVLEFRLCARQEHVYTAQLMPWLRMAGRHKEPGH